MSTRITCYGGVGEIGGNKILLDDGRRRLLFDFGKAFGRYNQFFDGVFLTERPQRGLLDLLALELIPPLPGLLRNDLIPVLDPANLHVVEVPPRRRQKKARQHVELSPKAIRAFWQYWQDRFPGVFRDLRRPQAMPVDLALLSHAHLDHIGDVEYLAPEIPICSTRMTAFISKVLLDLGPAGHSGAPFVKPRALSPEGLLHADPDQAAYAPRPWFFLDGAPEGQASQDSLETAYSFWATPVVKNLNDLKVAPTPPGLKLEHWPVDHSLFGAVGYAVETQVGWVAYTGDFRFNGRNQTQTRAFAERLAQLRPTALLCEGTRLTGPLSSGATEEEVRGNCLRAAQKAKGRLIVADFAPRNVERLLAFVEIASETGRCLLLQPRDAYLLRAMHLADPDNLPDLMQHPHVRLYADPKVHPLGWEHRVVGRYAASMTGPAHVQKNPGEYILAFSLTDIADMLDLEFLMRGKPGGIYIFSNSHAYDEEQRVDLVRLWHWAQHLGLELVGLRVHRRANGEVLEVVTEAGYHASGHAGAAELAEFVRATRPKALIPIHTVVPERWRKMLKGTGIRLIVPEYGKPILVS